MEPLPYFLLLLQKNVLLCSIVATGSFTRLDLSQTEHRVHSEQALDFYHFELGGKEVFQSVNILVTESSTSLTFHTNDETYFYHPERYFGCVGTDTMSGPYSVSGVEAKTKRKYLGKFILFDTGLPPASVYVRHSSLYGYVVSVSFYKHDLD